MEQKKKKSNKVKFILIGLGVVAIGAGTAYYFYQKKKKSQSIIPAELLTEIEESTTLPARTGSSSSSGFPLKRGSKGELVKNIQEALIKKYGSGILPKFGADGYWGSEMDAALSSKNLPSIISADEFKKILTAGSSSSTSSKPKPKFNPSLIATNLRIAIIDDDLAKAKRVLGRIWTVKGYKKVNEIFKEKRIGGVRKTIVNALLTKFSSTSEKKALNAHFYRMGLKFNGSQWSLSGIAEEQIKSIEDAKVWDSNGRSIKVPKNTILGCFLDAQKDVTSFQTLDDKILFTHTKCICYV